MKKLLMMFAIILVLAPAPEAYLSPGNGQSATTMEPSRTRRLQARGGLRTIPQPADMPRPLRGNNVRQARL